MERYNSSGNSPSARLETSKFERPCVAKHTSNAQTDEYGSLM